MKKVLHFLWGIILMFTIVNICYADKTLELNEPIIEFKRDKKYKLQGFTATDKYLFMIMVGYEDSKSIINVYDLNTYKEIKSIQGNSLGHANDITYNKKNNKIYVLSSSGNNEIYTFNSNTFDYEGSFNIELPARSITYIEDEDIYAIRTISVGYKLNKNFSLISKIPFIVGMNFNIDLGRQGWAYYNKHIYYANWSWVRYGGDGANIIYVYDLDGKVQDVFYTDSTIGELEDIAFYKNKMVLGFNGYDGTIKFYKINIPYIDNKDIVVDTNKQDYNMVLWIFLGIFSILSIIVIIYIIIKKK